MVMQTPRVAVVGAGLSGLACALELKDQGFDVVVFEREATAGGRMNTRRREGFAFDFGASFLADCYSTVGALAARVGAPLASVGLVRHVVLRDGRYHRLNFSSLTDALRFGALSPLSRTRALLLAAWARRYDGVASFFDLSTVPAHLLGESAYDFARRTAGEEFADYVVDPFTSTMMFYRAHDICAGAFVALFGMMAGGHYSFGVRRLVGGMQALPSAIARRVCVRTSSPVTDVVPEGTGATVRGVGFRERFDTVVLACPAPSARRVLQKATPAQSAVLLGTRYSSTIDVSFRVPLPALEDVHCVYVPHRESALISELTNEAVKGDEAAHAGLTLVNVGLHESGAAPLLAAPDGVVRERVETELRRLHPGIAAVAGRIEFHDLQRWTHAIPRYDGAHVARVSRFWSGDQGAGGVWLCGDYMNHPWLEGAALCGKRVAAGIIRHLSKHRMRAQV